jgi:hypothetical protein
VSATSCSARISRSRTSRTSSRRRRLSTALHFPEHARLSFGSAIGARRLRTCPAARLPQAHVRSLARLGRRVSVDTPRGMA